VMAMGSDIHVHSELGHGSVFSFALRLTEATALATPTPTPAERSASEPRPALSILVVDDQPINCMVARKMLERLGHQADLASDGQEALAAAESGAYDVIFMDLHMPGMTGLETTVRIRERLANGRVPYMVALTAAVFEEDREACRAAGMHDFLGKPIESTRLEAVLARVPAHQVTPR